MKQLLTLKIRRGGEVSEYSLTQSITTIGRGNDNQIVLNDNLASLQHAILELVRGVPYITDLNSSNGTLLNGVKIEPGVAHILKAGDVISIGDFTLTVFLSHIAEEAAAPVDGPRAVHTDTKFAVPAKLIKLSRKKLLAIIVGVVVVIGVIAGVSLTGADANAEIRDGVVNSLAQISDEGIEVMDEDIARIDEEISEVIVRQQKFEEVAAPAMAWVEAQKIKAPEDPRSSWITRVGEEGLARLKNDYYHITKMEFVALDVGTPTEDMSGVVEVTDLTTYPKTTRSFEAAFKELEQEGLTLEQRREEKLISRDMSTATLKKVISYRDEWEIRKINKTTYSISGPGLGIPTAGIWTYYRSGDAGEIVPADSPSKALKEVLLGES